MGWEDAHLYAFLAGNKRWSPPDLGFDNDALPVATASLADIIAASGAAPIRYIYDFGDDWVHLITVQTTDAAGKLCLRAVKRWGADQGADQFRCLSKELSGEFMRRL